MKSADLSLALTPVVEVFEQVGVIYYNKLNWLRMGDGVAERQRNDVLGVLKVQAQALDYTYLYRWAAELRLTGLFGQALKDAGIKAE